MSFSGPVVALAGGVGGAKLAVGLAHALPEGALTVIVNTADDLVLHGLHISPDIDTVMYNLAGMSNPETGWGIDGDGTSALELLGRYGGPHLVPAGRQGLGNPHPTDPASGRRCSPDGSDPRTRSLSGHQGEHIAHDGFFHRHTGEDARRGTRVSGLLRRQRNEAERMRRTLSGG